MDALLGGEPAGPDRLSRIETTLNALQTQMTEVRQRLGLAPLGNAQTAHDGRPTVATAIITHNNRVLMTRRRFKEGSLVWGFVTGECEPDETPEQAAVREVEEEVGLTVTVEQRLGERIHPASGRHMAYFACRVIAGEARLIDHEELAELAWCTLAEAAERAAGAGGIYAPVQEYLERVLT